MAIIITYDVPEKHRELKKELTAMGYKDQIPGIKNCKIIFFPNTTFYHPTKTSKTAVDDVQSICNKLSVKLERCISTTWDNWYAICGEDFK
jgi:hypothetical protein